MSALFPEADMIIVGINVCFVPKADIKLPDLATELGHLSLALLCYLTLQHGGVDEGRPSEACSIQLEDA